MEDRKHALYSPSGSHKWLHCPLAVDEGLPRFAPPWGTSAADKGTKLHDVLEKALELRDFETARQHIIANTNDDSVTLIRIAELYFRYKGMDGCEAISEKQLQICDDCYGYVDIGFVIPNLGVLGIIDYKSGRHPVEVIDNPQLKLYAYGLYNSLSEKTRERIQHILLYIGQAREIKKFLISAESLKAWMRAVVLPAIARHKNPGKRYPNVGEWCTWCLVDCGQNPNSYGNNSVTFSADSTEI
ncbi:MAG: DUF2800 domain-containing protein [Clostridiales bacterium]|jgi:hypothetical protein|nr:DUF2800 domain-containing protein [Clostridiales bacterium]